MADNEKLDNQRLKNFKNKGRDLEVNPAAGGTGAAGLGALCRDAYVRDWGAPARRLGGAGKLCGRAGGARPSEGTRASVGLATRGPGASAGAASTAPGAAPQVLGARPLARPRGSGHARPPGLWARRTRAAGGGDTVMTERRWELRRGPGVRPVRHFLSSSRLRSPHLAGL